MAIFDSPDNLTLVTQLFSTADGFTNGLLGIIIWMVIGAGSLLLTSGFDTKESFISSSFILMVTSIFLKYGLNILGDFFVWLSAILFVIAIVISSLRSTPGA